MRIELRFRDEQVKKALNRAAKKAIRDHLIKYADWIEEQVKNRFAVNVRKTPEYKSLAQPGGKLRAYFGIEDPQESIPEIINILLDNVKVKVNRAINEGVDYMIALNITVFDKKSLRALVDSPVGRYVSDQNEFWSGAEIPWLKWLLLSGGQPVVFGYKVLRGEFEHYSDDGPSRTTRAIMVESDAGSFSVKPEEYRGTESNNFITRAAKGMENEIANIVADAINKKG